MRLSAGASDTVIINSRWPSRLPVRALDAAGRPVVAAPIRYAWIGGESLPVTPAGDLTCIRRGDVTVRATLGRYTRRLVVRCRPVRWVRIPGPLQFVLGDSALSRPLALPVEAYDSAARRVALVAGSAMVGDSGVASLRGLMLYPRSRGITLAWAHVGDGDGAVERAADGPAVELDTGVVGGLTV